MTMKHTLLLFATLLMLVPVGAQTSELTVSKIMRDQSTWIGSSPNRPAWSEDGEWLYFNWNPGGEMPSDSLFKVRAAGGDPIQVTPEERRGVRATFSGWGHGTGEYSADWRHKVFESSGDIYLLDRTTGDLKRITITNDREASPRFTADGRHILYQDDGNAFVRALDTGTVRQLTDLREGQERDRERPKNAQDSWLEKQQLELFDVLRAEAAEREAREEAREREQELAAADRPPVHYYGSGQVSGLEVSPDLRYATFFTSESTRPTRTIVQDYVTESGYAEDLNARSKVGVESSPRKFFVQDLESGDVVEVDMTTLEGAYDVAPAHLVDEGVEVDSSKARSMSAVGPFWSGDGKHAIVQVYVADNKDRWIASLDPATGALRVLDRQHDEAWIGGPGVRSFFGGGSAGWLPDNRTYWFKSEATGFSHLYTVDVVTGNLRQLTDGDFEVFGVEVSRDAKRFYFTSSEGSPFERHFYRMPIAGGARTRLTDEPGNNAVTLSPREDRAAIMFSTTTRPTDLFMMPFGRPATRVTSSPTEEWLAYPWRTGEMIEIPASDGVMVPAQVFRPEEPNGGAVLFVHGAGYLQNVHRWWSSYSREYMFHNMLTDLGYTVLNVDYRASSGYGRDWRTAIYRHMGGRDLQDYVDASKYVGTEYGIDPERVFIYGGSYGGFITLMALFNEAEHFGGGAALRSVTDWAHYNHGYTANILNTPVTDSLAYARSSPINFASGLEDPLLMAHGVIDTNVQYQDIIRLAQRLIELGKEDWELASYPVEGHGFQKPTSWTDEYSRILKLIKETVGPNRFR